MGDLANYWTSSGTTGMLSDGKLHLNSVIEEKLGS